MALWVVGSFLTVVGVLVLSLSIHQVDEGYRGIYWTGGKIQEGTSLPGFHLKMPFITSFAQVQISLQTDRVTNIPCGTSGGVVVTFDSIEVVNQLDASSALSVIREYGVDYDQLWIFDKIHHEINQFCSSHTLREVYIDLFGSLDESLALALQRDVDKYAPGIRILSARVTKPIIPDAIKRNYERMEAERTKLLISTERQKVVEKEAETERLKATILAEKQANVSKINMEKQITEKQAYSKIKAIEDAIFLKHQKAIADAHLYESKKRAEANRLKLTPEHLEKLMYDVIKGVPKTYFTESMSHIFGYGQQYATTQDQDGSHDKGHPDVTVSAGQIHAVPVGSI
mmetsp:Transcript_8413/g.16504  ORF Transcript_8413/g.16504 Transcript_8413/m.16504 type:complete len:343 (-) Transcript_8413:193-1221(-)|eukprot:CAMPEP_0170197076 /NCGR_PEP_ID=MMETSP0040_2-20121228/65487_1 /TAXON_ID=641309 /ORGANISM="Lotharella oceanica, Strain CCMP622" /LENGTH=342 /DNA_ID=CAMNT_0010446681 /DNA_START=30 /DNA_END=1058 /DNA_ORIENTATION=+